MMGKHEKVNGYSSPYHIIMTAFGLVDYSLPNYWIKHTQVYLRCFCLVFLITEKSDGMPKEACDT